IGELAPLLFDLALDLLPHASGPITIHNELLLSSWEGFQVIRKLRHRVPRSRQTRASTIVREHRRISYALHGRHDGKDRGRVSPGASATTGICRQSASRAR